MRAIGIGLLGIAVTLLTGFPPWWHRFVATASRIDPVQPRFTRLWARQLEVDEEDVAIWWNRSVRVVWFLVGLGMAIGSAVFLARWGLSTPSD